MSMTTLRWPHLLKNFARERERQTMLAVLPLAEVGRSDIAVLAGGADAWAPGGDA